MARQGGLQVKLKLLIGVVALAVSTTAAAMPVSTFLAKADALQKKGMLAMFSSDLGLLKSVTKGDIEAFAAQLKDHSVAACPPKNASGYKINFTSDELLKYYRAVPPARRNISSRQAFAEFMSSKYPCKR